MVRVLISLFGFVFSILIGCSLSAESRRPLTIGVIAPLTGRVAPVGEALRNSIQLASKESDYAGTRFIFEDDQFIPAQTVSTARKLIDFEHVDGLIVFGSGPALAIADGSEHTKTLTFAMAYSDEVSRGRSYVYRTFLTASSQARAIKEEVIKRDYSSIAMVTSTNEATVTIRNAVGGQLQSRTVMDLQIDPSDTDLKGAAARIMSAKPQAILLLLVPPQNSIFSRLLRSQGWKGTFFSSSHLNNPAEIAAAQGTLDGSWFVTVDDEAADAFNRQYTDTYGLGPVVDGTIGCDAVKLMINALNEPIPVTYLKNSKGFEGKYGKWLRTGPNTFEPPTRIGNIRGSS